ncbi:hypothetical protein ACTXT7_014705 [Hymenolepis weldensis]
MVPHSTLLIVIAAAAFKSLPFTAYTEISEWYTMFLLAQFGNKIDPNMTIVSTEPYASPATVYFQRITVIVSELSLMYSIAKLLTIIFGPLDEKKEPLYLTAVTLFAFNFGLFIVDHKALNTSGLFPRFCSKGSQEALDNRVSMTSGLTGNYQHLCLPTIRPIHTALLTFAHIIPSLVICTGRKTSSMESGFVLVRSIVSAAWASFLFGWHVHEKAVLVITLPLLLLSVVSRRLRGLCFYVSTIAHFSLLPLIFTPNEQPVVLSFYLLYTLVQYILLGRSSIPVKDGFLAKYWRHLTILGRIHLFSLIPLLFVTRIALPLLYPRFEFLPLMMTSIYCAVGLLVSFFIYTWINFSWIWNERLAEEEEKMEDAYYEAKASFFKKNN